MLAEFPGLNTDDKSPNINLKNLSVTYDFVVDW